MKQRLLSLLLVCVLVAGLIPALPSHAATQSPNSPYAMIEYGYSGSVTCGTVRYISQVASDSYFYSSYWHTAVAVIRQVTMAETLAVIIAVMSVEEMTTIPEMTVRETMVAATMVNTCSMMPFLM